MRRIFDFTPKKRKPDSSEKNMDYALIDYNAAVEVLERRRWELICACWSISDKNAKARKILAQLTNRVSIQ